MPKISLSGSAELLTIIPFHLGFVPVRSVVVMCFHGKRLGLVARLDLLPDTQSGDTATRVAVIETLPALMREEPSSVALVGYEDAPGESRSLLQALADAFEQERVVVRERLVVRDHRWFDLDCACCALEGQPLPELGEVPAVASYVALGHAVLPARDDLCRLVEPLAETDPRHDVISAKIAEWQRRYVAAGGRCDPARSGGAAAATDLADDSPAGLADGPSGDLADEASDDLTDGPAEDLADDLMAGLGTEPGDDGDVLTARQFLLRDAMRGWGRMLRGEISDDLERWLPSIVGPLRDPVVRDAIVAWLCPDSAPLQAFPSDVISAIELFVGQGVRVPPAGVTGPPARERRPRRGRRKRGRRVDRSRASQVTGVPAVSDGAVAPASPGPFDSGLDDWEAAGAPRAIHARLEQVCRLTPAAHAAPLLSLVASFGWWCGDGARAGIAADRALELEPDHRLSWLVREALTHGIRATLGA